MAGCISNQHSGQVIDYAFTQQFLPGKTTKEELASSLGAPAALEKQEGFQSLLYSQDGLQRPNLVINDATGVLDHLIWIQRPGEPQAQLRNFLETHPSLKFEEFKPQQENPHYISAESSLVDRHAGITLIVQNRETIEALIRVDMNSGLRQPATSKELGSSRGL